MEIEDLKKENALLKEALRKAQAKKELGQHKKKKFFHFIAGFFAGKSLKKSVLASLKEYNEQRKISLETTSSLITSLIKRLTRIGVMALLIALLPTSLMLYQNNLLKIQNKKIQDQTYLSEAARRSSQMFIMGDVLSDINTEIESKGFRKLSNTLTGRVVSLSRAMKPYRYLIEDKIIAQPISPERGQLLITLCKSKLNSAYFVDEILQESDFTKSELMNANLKSTVLREVNLKGSNLAGANLRNVDFRSANLAHTNLRYTDLEDANLNSTDLQSADFTGAYLTHTKLVGANLENAKLDSVKVDRADWLQYIKDELKLKGAQKLFENYRVDSVFYESTSSSKGLMILKL